MQTDEIEQFVGTVDYDFLFPTGPGKSLIEKERCGSAALTEALLLPVRAVAYP